MLTNRRSTMTVPPNRMPSWHPQSKPYPPQNTSAPLSFDTEVLQSRTPAILTCTTSTLPGHRVLRVLGAVHGTTSALRKDTKSFVKNFASSFGGSWAEAKSLTSLIYQVRNQAIDRMVKEAIGLGANAIVGLTVRESDIMGCVVVSVGGTACWVVKGPENWTEKEKEEEKEEEKRDSAQEEDPFR